MVKKAPVLKKRPVQPVSPLSQEKMAGLIGGRLLNRSNPSRQWLIFSALLVVGIIILAFASMTTLGLLKNIKFNLNPPATQVPIQTFTINRSAKYAGLTYTIINAQYAPSFPNDGIHPGVATVRLNMSVTNSSKDAVNVIYYDIARLLAPKISPIAPTNVSLSVGPQPGKSETGWLDFSVPQPLQLNTLTLQLGSTLLGEYLVKIPFTGAFNPNVYNDRTSPQAQDMNYYFPHDNPQLLIYHLVSVEVRYAYQGVQVGDGQQYYILNFRVDNPNGSKVSPGYGYDYLRLMYNGGPPHSPKDNSLPYGFNAGAHGVSGHVVFVGPAGLHAFTLRFLVQYGSGGTDFPISF